MSLLPQRAARPFAVMALVFLAAATGACSETNLREQSPPSTKKADNLLRVKGEYCTQRRTDVAFPVKVLYVLDQSYSLQFTDTNKKRYDALNRSLDKLARQQNVEFAFIGFSSWARSSATEDRRFTEDKSEVSQFLQNPSNGLGTATDYQGALATALRFVESDIRSLEPVERARTRYVVNFISDGVPTPRCKQGCEDDRQSCSDGRDNDGDGQVDGADPDCDNIDDNDEHPDNLYGICNINQDPQDIDGVSDDEYVEFEGSCPAYNQPRQILSRVQEIMDLQRNFNIGGIRMNTVFLFAPEEVVQSRLPNSQSQFAVNREEASQLLQTMADRGEGTFRDVNTEGSDRNFLEFEVTSVEADRTLTTFFARNAHAVSTPDGLVADIDRDGLSDPVEREAGLDREAADTDGDGYSDLFERRFADEGFDPTDDSAPTAPCQSSADRDGDGLRDCEEQIVGTDARQPDTDADGITDWLEIASGTKPLEEDAHADVDFDGVENLEEVRGGTNPTVADADRYRNSRIRYSIEELGLQEFDTGNVQRRCYDYDVREVPLATTPIPGERGLNRILIRAGERPSKIAGVSPEMRTACVEAFYNEGGIKNPRDGVVELSQKALDRTRREIGEDVERVMSCPLLENKTARRRRIVSATEQCMGPTIELGNYRFEREVVLEMMRRHLEGNLEVKLPDRPFEFFEPLPTFDPEDHCHRPWEIDRVQTFLEKLARRCRECAEESSNGGSGGGG